MTLYWLIPSGNSAADLFRTMLAKLRLPLILAGLASGVCVALGFARFAYGLILPPMQEDLGWSYTEAGWMNTANALGYVIGAFGTFFLINRLSAATLFSVGMLATGGFLILNGMTEDFWFLTVWRLSAGISSAAIVIGGGALASGVFPGDPRRSAMAIAVFFGGGGIGVALPGFLLPDLFAQKGAAVWPDAWVMLGAASLALAPLSLWSAWRLSRRAVETSVGDEPSPTNLPLRRMMPAFSGYTMFAIGYIVYITFVTAWMRDQAASPGLVSAVWVTLGLAAAISPFIWRLIFARFASGVPLALVNAMTAAGTLLPLFLFSEAGLLISAALFGAAVMMGPGSVTAFSRRNLPPQAWGRGIGFFTMIFSVGQAAGPVAAGAIGDLSGDIAPGLAAAGAVLAIGAALAALQKPLPLHHSSGR